MIFLERVRTAETIPAGFYGKGRESRELKLLKAKRDGALKDYFDNGPWKTAKEELRQESRIKCAYCEGPIENQHGDVEHFRPKSIWWWLAVCYDNYLPSCQFCNQVYKSDKFPFGKGGKARGEPRVKATATEEQLKKLLGTFAPDPVTISEGRTLEGYLNDCAKEKPLLINPSQEKPEDFIIYEADATLRQVKVLPRKPAHEARIKACEDCFGINRETLCEQRFIHYESIELTWQAWDQSPASVKPVIAKVLELAVRPERAFAGMARYFVREVWRVPGV